MNRLFLLLPLLNFLGFRPIKARPLGLATRTYRMIRRNPTYSAVFVLLFLLVVVGPLVLGVQQKLANIEIQKALEQAEEEAATSEQVIEYLEEIFKSSSPFEGKGKEVSAYEVLQRGVAMIDGELNKAEKDEILGFVKKINLTQNQVKTILCETRVKINLQQATVKCAHCNAALTPESKFCTACGSKVE